MRRSCALFVGALAFPLSALPGVAAAGSGTSDGPADAVDPACSPEQVACALGEGPAARDARLARLSASLDQAADARGEPTRAARLAEIARRIEPVRAPLERTFDSLRSIAIRLVREHADARSSEAVARLEAARLRWPDAVGLARAPEVPPHRAFVRGCGPSLMLDEGWISNDRRDIALCPGFVLLELDRAAGDPDPAADAASFLVAHELGHVIENTADDPDAERAADRWARAILAEYVRARAGDGAEPSKVVARALSSFCDLPPGDPLHGDGIVRAALAARAVEPMVCRGDLSTGFQSSVSSS